MTVKELRKYLDDCNDDAIIVMAKESEGSIYTPVLATGKFTRSPVIRDGEVAKDCNAIDAVVLWPTS